MRNLPLAQLCEDTTTTLSLQEPRLPVTLTLSQIIGSPQAACELDPCENGGTCRPVEMAYDFKCACPPGFFGRQCEKCKYACIFQMNQMLLRRWLEESGIKLKYLLLPYIAASKLLVCIYTPRWSGAPFEQSVITLTTQVQFQILRLGVLLKMSYILIRSLTGRKRMIKKRHYYFTGIKRNLVPRLPRGPLRTCISANLFLVNFLFQ